ncbi:acyltransferase [Staphylococcus capitis]|uniref:acyltransferase n=1 Tax=Staphylococcus capitis TaxID=29388 RepID=UPI001D15BDFD|nr:acyltransferase [Staphylococcus capitis]MCC3756086.1 acyltransferase [Staphylococcus capitis]MDH8729173.1 acyltransferase [Staphylococcus capitis]MDH8921357.1 acyltransferase [Staphylococcus capitis]MDH8942560.1 acyltransferase [Staphylococcus capitis]MDH9592333.1 acyltransferase [Staphylococcus capitis]
MKFTHRLINLMQIPYNKLPMSLSNMLWNIFTVSDSKFAVTYRYMYLKKYARFVDRNVYVGKFVCLKNIDSLTIGKNVSIHSFNYVDAYGEIFIGNNVSIANHCTLISSEHTWDDKNRPIKFNAICPRKIVIEDDVWIASGVRVLGGNTIRERNIIAAGAVLTKSTEPNSLYVGIPAKRMKEV